jgi:RNA polymerase sigma-70 factor (ECF subfamily)
MTTVDPIDLHGLIDEIKGGNKEAYRRFIKQYERLVIHIIYRMVSNPSDREDLFQDVFLKAYQNLGGFRFQSKASTWLARITYNTCINFLQKKRTPLFDDKTPETLTIEDIADSDELPDDWVSKRDMAKHIEEEIQKLPLRHRTALTLYHLHGLHYTEIGQIMDLPESSVKSYLFRGRQQLKVSMTRKFRSEVL